LGAALTLLKAETALLKGKAWRRGRELLSPVHLSIRGGKREKQFEFSSPGFVKKSRLTTEGEQYPLRIRFLHNHNIGFVP